MYHNPRNFTTLWGCFGSTNKQGQNPSFLQFQYRSNHERSNKNSSRSFGHHPYWVLSRSSFLCGQSKKTKLQLHQRADLAQNPRVEGKTTLTKGWEILIKAVLQAMQTYTMGCFLLPKSLCKDIEALIPKFWWGYKGEARKIHWVAWKNLCLSKNNGGLGFKDIVNFNLALLGKQVWRLLHNTDSLLYKPFKSKYFPNCSILDDEVKTNGSYAWQGILKARQVVRMGARWRIGNGESVIIRKDKWLPTPHASCIILPQRNFPNNAQVCALIDEENSCWIEDRVQGEFLPYQTSAILSLPLNQGGAADKLIWSATKNGVYTTKTAY